MTMRTVGIIAEYNPFHSGHAWQIRRAIELSGGDYVIAVMSPDFVQRGSPALIDKWTRARMALSAGVSLVLELPVCYASASAEYFAEGGVSLLSSLGCVDFLSFGCESADLRILKNAADFFADAAENGEPEEYRKLLQSKVKAGMPYPKARAEAYLRYVSPAMEHTNIAEAERELALPNNILALEYLKAIRRCGSSLKPLPIHRIGEGYHSSGSDSLLSGSNMFDLLSAESIRALLKADSLIPEGALPESSRGLLESARKDHSLLFDEDLNLVMQIRLIELASQEKSSDLTEYLDVTGDLANRIRKHLDEYESFHQFVSLLKTRDMTETRIRRSLIHILLGIRKEEAEAFRQAHSGNPSGPAGYARILGFRKGAAPLLRRIRTSSQIPLVSGVPEAMHIYSKTGDCMLGPDARAMLKQTLYSSRLYSLVLQSKTGRMPVSEYRRQPVIL